MVLGSLALLALLAADQAPAPRTIEVSGRVLDARGKPSPKAEVALLPVAENGEALTSASTDTGGRFRLAAPDAGMYRVIVRATGAVPAETSLLPLLAPIELAPLRTQDNAPLRVRVLGADGTPVAGVRVAAWPTSGQRPDGWIAASRAGTTDESGTVVLPRSAGESLEVAATGGELAFARASRVTASSIDLRAEAACARPLTVRDGNGSAVAGARVSTESVLLATTNEEGSATIYAPCRSDLRVSIAASDGRSARTPLQHASPEQPSAPLAVMLEAPDRFTGRVLDADSRAPIAGALVWSADDPAAFVRSDAKGTYVLARPAQTSGDLRAAASGHLPRGEKTSAKRGPNASGPTFALQPTATLAGAVVDGSGRAVGGAEIQFDEYSSDALFRFRTRPEGIAARAMSRDDGTFRIEVLPRRAYTLRASRTGFAPATLTVAEKLAPAAVKSGLRLVLTSGMGAFGRIVDERAAPVAAAEIRLVRSSARDSLPSFLRAEDEIEEEPLEAFSDAEGGFRFEHLPAGRFELTAKADGFVRRTVKDIAIESGAANDLGEIALERGLALTGTVTDRRGKPLTGATVSAFPPSATGVRAEARELLAGGQEIRSTKSEANGRFSLDGLAHGETIDVIARLSGYVAATLPQLEMPPSQPVQLVLEPAARVSGRVKTEQGEPVPGAVVAIRPVDAALPAGLSGSVADTDAAGTYVLQDLEPGKMAVSASAKGFVSGEPVVLEVGEGRNIEDVDLTLHRGAALEGTVSMPNGQPAIAARVTLRHSNRMPDRLLDLEVAGASQTDGDGRFRMEGVPLGAQTVIATQPGYQPAVREIEVRSGDNRVDLRLAEGFAVSGRVVDGSGRPLAGTPVNLLTSGPGMAEEDVSGSDGAFRFTGLGAGRYSVAAQKEGYGTARQEVQISDRAVDGVELRLQQGAGVISGRILGLPLQSMSQLQIMATKRPMDNLDALREGNADGQGAYRIEGVHAGDWTVTARLPNGRQAQKSVSVSEGSPAQLDLEFGGGVTLSGRVRRHGQPVANATVEVSGVGVDSSGSTVTDGGGAFRIEGLTAGEHRLAVNVAQSGLHHERAVTLGGDQTIDVDLPSARASGTVVDGVTRSPLAGVTVIAEPVAGGSSVLSPRVTTDSYGAFELTNLDRGSYRLTGTKDGYARATLPLELPSDDTSADGLSLMMEPEQGLLLDVTSSAGMPPARIGVALLDPAGQLVFAQTVTTGEGGRTRVPGAPAGSFRLLVGADGAATIALGIAVPGQPVPVMLPRAGRVTIEIPELTGTGAVASVMLLDAEGQPFRSVSRGPLQQEWPVINGFAVIDGVPSGNFTARAAGPNGGRWEGMVAAAEGQEARVTLR